MQIFIASSLPVGKKIWKILKEQSGKKNRTRRYGRHVDIRVALNVNLACKCIIPLPGTTITVFVLRYEMK